METSKLKTIDTEVLVAIKERRAKVGRSQLNGFVYLHCKNSYQK